jgi:hypothetical protein
MFKGYRRDSMKGDGRDDWMVITGYARGGDSGGPVFNQRGLVVGVLWGTDGQEVVCVQPGRLHLVLQAAIGVGVLPRSFSADAAGGFQLVYPMDGWQTPVPVRQAFQRNPTAPMPGPEPWQPVQPQAGCGPGGCGTANQAAEQAADSPGGSWLPWRSGVEGKLSEISRGQAETNRRLEEIARQQQAQPPVVVPAAPGATPKEEAKDGGPRTAVGRLADRESQWLAEHGGPISSRIAANAAENLDSDSAAVRFKGFTQAKVAVLVFCAAVLLVLGLGVWVLHRVNNKLIPKLQEAAAKTSNTADDKLVELLAKLHGRVDTVEAKATEQLSGLKGKVDAALNIGTAAALATPAAPAAVAIQAVKAVV